MRSPEKVVLVAAENSVNSGCVAITSGLTRGRDPGSPAPRGLDQCDSKRVTNRAENRGASEHERADTLIRACISVILKLAKLRSFSRAFRVSLHLSSSVQRERERKRETPRGDFKRVKFQVKKYDDGRNVLNFAAGGNAHAEL